MNTVKILNVEIDNLTTQELLNQLESGVVYTPNVDHLVKLQHDTSFMEVYQDADYKVCDSKILMYGARFLGQPLKEKVSGSDFFPAFYEFHRDNPAITIFLLGAMEGVAAKAQEKINQKVGREIIVGTYSPPYGFEKDEQECQKIIDMVNASGATVLAVGVGAPKQEKFIHAFREQFSGIRIFLAIGATIDFEAGNVNRAPKWMSNLGIEWLYRLTAEPQRLWKRYLLEDPQFVWLLLLQKFNIYRDPLAQKNPADLNHYVKSASSPS